MPHLTGNELKDRILAELKSEFDFRHPEDGNEQIRFRFDLAIFYCNRINFTLKIEETTKDAVETAASKGESWHILNSRQTGLGATINFEAPEVDKTILGHDNFFVYGLLIAAVGRILYYDYGFMRLNVHYVKPDFDDRYPEEIYQVLNKIRHIEGWPADHETIENIINEVDKPLIKETGTQKNKTIDNQAVSAGKPGSSKLHLYENLRFRSKNEIMVAKALDREEVMYFPNCKARLGHSDSRQNLEPDFLICYKGNWGILEVDGSRWHGPASAAKDHERARLFKANGIRVVEHYEEISSFDEAREVVSNFLTILELGYDN